MAETKPRFFIATKIKTLRSALVTGVFLLAISSPSFADDPDVESKVVNGHKVDLVQEGQGDFRVRVDGKEVIKKQLPQAELNFEGVYTGAGRSYVVISRTVFNCGLHYEAIDLTGPTPVVSPQMGGCSGPAAISVVNGELQVTFRTPNNKVIIETFSRVPKIQILAGPGERQAPAAKGDAAGKASSGWSFPDDWSAWVGKYPQDRVKGLELLQIPQVKEALNAIIGAHEKKQIAELRVSVPIERHGDWIVAHGCMPHDCPSSNYTLAISGDVRDIILCLKTDGDASGTSTLRWFRTGQQTASKTFPFQTGAACTVEGADPMPALLGRAALDGDGKPL